MQHRELTWLSRDAVMVNVDADVGVCSTECCIVAGVELSSAPRRPINFKTLLKKMDFVPYGENRDTDAKRLAYYGQVRGYIKARVQPAIEAVKATSEETPKHLEKVQPASLHSLRKMAACDHNCQFEQHHRWCSQ